MRISNYEESASTDSGKKALTVKRQLRAIGRYIAEDRQVRKATKQLALHGLVVEKMHSDREVSVLIVSLTVEGYDLGRRYSNWFDRTGLCFQEYRNHWLWLIFAFFGGAIINTVIQNVFGPVAQ